MWDPFRDFLESRLTKWQRSHDRRAARSVPDQPVCSLPGQLPGFLPGLVAACSSPDPGLPDLLILDLLALAASALSPLPDSLAVTGPVGGVGGGDETKTGSGGGWSLST